MYFLDYYLHPCCSKHIFTTNISLGIPQVYTASGLKKSLNTFFFHLFNSALQSIKIMTEYFGLMVAVLTGKEERLEKHCIFNVLWPYSLDGLH